MTSTRFDINDKRIARLAAKRSELMRSGVQYDAPIIQCLDLAMAAISDMSGVRTMGYITMRMNFHHDIVTLGYARTPAVAGVR